MVRLGVAALLLSGLISALHADVSARAEQRSAARRQFERAKRVRAALLAKPEENRTLEEYLQLVARYRRVYLITAHAAEAPTALMVIAQLYQEMGRQFDRKYYQSAIDAYQFLLHEYPTNHYREAALLNIAKIQKGDLGQPELARKTLEEFVKLHPRSPKVQEARKALAEISELTQAEQKPVAEQKPAAEQVRAEDLPRRMPQVTSLRAWNAANYTRIVIDLEERVKYESARLSDPDRIYFDLHDAKLSPALAGKTFEVPGGFLKGIRVAQNQIGVVRVVLDVNKVKDYSVFTLSNPYRLVVDVYGFTVTTANSATPAQPERIEPAPAAGARAGPPKAASPTEEKPARSAPKPSKSVREAAATLGPPPTPQPNRNGQHSLTRALGLKIGRIVIDPGHGGQDTGTIGPTGLMEKDLCLDIALRLGKLIQQRLPGAEVVYTREDDSHVPLERRTTVANEAQADLFISIHANSSNDKKIRGVETYYLNFASSEEAMEVAARENALAQVPMHELQEVLQKIVRNEKIEESRELASNIQEALTKRLKRVSRNLKDRGVRKAPFVVLVGANMPSVLSEISFLSNPTDERLLKKPDQRQRVAEGLYRGVEDYLQSINSLSYNQTKTSVGNR